MQVFMTWTGSWDVTDGVVIPEIDRRDAEAEGWGEAGEEASVAAGQRVVSDEVDGDGGVEAGEDIDAVAAGADDAIGEPGDGAALERLEGRCEVNPGAGGGGEGIAEEAHGVDEVESGEEAAGLLRRREEPHPLVAEHGRVEEEVAERDQLRDGRVG
jgi:hypothetical protein